MNDPLDHESSARRFGRNFEAMRLARGASRRDLAKQLGYHVSYIGAIERGERNITLKTSDKLAKSLGVTVGDLLRR
jgi:transcriptional regulator with XRE-family HTH domain